MSMNKNGLYVPCDYFRELKHIKKNRKKARAFMEYYDDLDLGEHNSVRFYATSWDIGIGTAHGWIDDFKIEIDKYYASRQLLNTEHYTSAKKETEQSEQDEMNTLNTNQSQDNGIIKNMTEQSEQDEMNKVNNASSNSNIYVESNDSDSNKSSNDKPKKKKVNYTNNFEILWQEYNKKSGNKERAFSIYQKRYKNVDTKLMIEAIKSYKNLKEDWRDLKDFDGLLNGMIDIYLPKRAWIIDRNNKKHLGHFYDAENKFISDEQQTLSIESKNISNYIQEKRFGYV